MRALNPHLRVNYSQMATLEEFLAAIARFDHCSALIKVADDLSDVLIGHSTWFSYSSMLRIYKQYEFNFHNWLQSANKIQFSSYPGMISSGDDFYITSAQLVVMETTNGFVENSLYDLINPHTLFSWQRVRAASALANSGEEWYFYAQFWNSGTYANQYQILDYKLFAPRNAVPNNTLWVVEVLPGLVVGADMSSHLNRQYWPSYNVPFFPEIYQVSGYADMDR